MVTIQGVFLDNVGASEALLQLPEHMKLNPLMLMGQPHAGNKNQGNLPHGRRGAQCLKAAPVLVLLFLVDGPSGRGSVVMAELQHNVWEVLLS